MNPLAVANSRLVIAHRGGAARAPENTLEAMRLGVSDGADAIELDVRLSADGEVVVFHDATVERTTGVSGAIDQMTLDALRTLDAGCRFSGHPHPAVTNNKHRIPTLSEVLGEFPSTPLIIEIKAAAAARPARALIERHRAEGRCLVDAYSAEALRAFRGSRIARGGGRAGTIALLAKSFFAGASAARTGISALCIPPDYHGVRVPVRRLAKLMRSAGKPVHLWTVDDPAEALAFWEMGVSGIITNDVRATVAARSRAMANKAGTPS